MNKTKFNLRVGLIFLLLDLLFWGFVFGSCTINPIDCPDTQVFGTFFWYQPLTLLLASGFSAFSAPGTTIMATNIFLAIVGGAMHFLFGYLIGAILQKTKLFR